MSKVGGANLNHMIQQTQANRTSNLMNQMISNTVAARPNPLAQQAASNEPGCGAKFATGCKKMWQGVKNGKVAKFFKKVGNSRGGVGSGHAAQGFLGVSAFRSAFNRARGSTAPMTKLTGIKYDTNNKNVTSRHATKQNRTRTQAHYASQGAVVGTALSVGVLPLAGAIVGGVCGLVARACSGPRAQSKADAQVAAKKNMPANAHPTLHAAKTLDKLQDRVATLARGKTGSLSSALTLSKETPSRSRWAPFASNSRLPSKQSVRDFQGIMEHSIDKEFATENADFNFAVKFLDKAPTKENCDFLMQNFVQVGARQEINLRGNHGGAMRQSLTNDGKMSQQLYGQLTNVVENGVDSPQFSALPKWAQNGMLAAERDRNQAGDNSGPKLSDAFYHASAETKRLSSDAIRRFAM